MTPRILVAGVGNVFFEDDGFGVEVARRLAESPPPGARVADFGIRGIHLAFALLENVEVLIAIDATPRGGTPGTVYVIEPELSTLVVPESDPHGMSLPVVFASLRNLGGKMPRVLIVGCEPECVSEGIGLSPKVQAAVEPAIELVRQVVARELARLEAAARGEKGTAAEGAASLPERTSGAG